MATYEKPKALIFDVFGTVVAWRSTITAALKESCKKELQSEPPPDSQKSLTDVKSVLSGHSSDKRKAALKKAKELGEDFWDTFAQEWREAYFAFTASFVPASEVSDSKDETGGDAGFATNGADLDWIGVDAFHYSALVTLLHIHELNGLFPGKVLRSLTLTWHKLPPHPDAISGIREISQRQGIPCYTLGNGNTSILNDLSKFSKVPFEKWLGAEDFKAYKPSSKTYLGLVKQLQLKPEEVGMVAAHMNDCLSASTFGLQAFYIQRPEKEEMLSDEECKEIIKSGKLLREGIFDGEGGFEELARRLNSSSGKH